MDPLAHTLFGAALAQAGLRRACRHATAALLIGANLPDIDGIAQLFDRDTALHVRRGWTHGLLAMVVLPLLLTAAIVCWQRWRDRGRDARPPRPWMLLAVACIGVWSHPLLDWLNTYGVRLLMPFDGRWFYGDTLFIVDPWLWLMLAAGVVVGRSQGWPARFAWALLGAAGSVLVLGRGLPPAVPVAWFSGLALIVLLRWQLPRNAAARVAQVGVASCVVYASAMHAIARDAEARVRVQFPGAIAVQASPMPGQPFAHRIVVQHADRYHVLEPDGARLELPRVPADAVVQQALADPSIRGFAGWTRFPWWQVEPDGDGWHVRFFDLRYARPGAQPGGIGHAEVRVPRDPAGR